MFKSIAFFIIKLFVLIHGSVGILLTCRNHSMIWLRGEIWANDTSLARHFLWKCLYQGKWGSFICVLGISILPLSTILIFDFGIVPTVWYFLSFILYMSVAKYWPLGWRWSRRLKCFYYFCQITLGLCDIKNRTNLIRR